MPLGIVLTKPITIIGGTFFDPTDTPTAGPSSRALQPIILIRDTDHVTLSGISVLGVNTGGTYHRHLVNEAGIKIKSSSDVTLTDITARNTFGDGLELVADSSHVPVTRLSVQGYTVVNAGRQAVTLAEVSDSVLDHVDIVSEADAGFDFESDLPNLGSGNVTISNCIDNHGFNMIEPLTGPVTVVNCTGFHRVHLGGPHGTAPVNFVGGSMSCRWRDPVPCIRLNGGSMTFTGVTIDREVGRWPPTTAVWAVRGAGNLTFAHCPIQLPMGWTADTSTVTFVP